ncbi:MAG: hypothetical protein U1E73_12245 [Planctomycetota bacterium]
MAIRELVVLSWLVLLATRHSLAQEATDRESGAQLAARIRAGEWFEQAKFRRAADGTLEVNFFGGIGQGPGSDWQNRYEPLLGKDLECGIATADPLAVFGLFCHGSGDLLGMTDAAFHLTAAGIGTDEAALRKLAATPGDPADRANQLERMLAIDLLARSGVRKALGDLRGIAKSDGPEPLRRRAREALARLEGRPPSEPRRHLDAASMRLPAQFDLCIAVEHAHLPDLSWWMPLARRSHALAQASLFAQVFADRPVRPDWLNTRQRHCDVNADLPFGLVQRHGDARVDQSVVAVTGLAADREPAVLWRAAGDFGDGWQTAAMPSTSRRAWWQSGSLRVAADHLDAEVGDIGTCTPRAELADHLLRHDEKTAIRAIVPRTSGLWQRLANDLPSPPDGEIDIAFGEPIVVECSLQTADADAAAAWAEALPGRLTRWRKLLLADMPVAVQEDPEVKGAFGDAFDPQITVEGATLRVTARIRGLTPEVVRRFVTRLLGGS